MEESWDAFEAEERFVNDSSESCAAKLYYTDDAGSEQMIVGATGKGGHAEMHALTQFLRNVCSHKNVELVKYVGRGLVIECPAKSCCVRCSIILGALKFRSVGGDYVRVDYEIERVRGGDGKPRNRKKRVGSALCRGDTYKTQKPMGSTEWALAPDVRKLLGEHLELTEQNILDISALTGF